jgi:predicted phosphodiesterase
MKQKKISKCFARKEGVFMRIATCLEPAARRIFIGDVHGCFDELRALLARVRWQRDVDSLILVGDVVRKGPRSADVLRFCRENRVLSVLGNHDVRALRKDEEWSQQLSHEDWEWLESRPHILRLPRENVLVVHAGLVPGKALEQHSVDEVTRMRFVVDGEGKETDHRPGKVRWANLWTGPETVVFGHDASAGLQKLPFAYGLDSGVVYGNHLTALLMDENGKIEIVQEKAHKVHCQPVPIKGISDLEL